MKAHRTGGELSLPHVFAGALAAAVVMVITRRLVLQPLLGFDKAQTTADFLMWFLLGYLAMAVAPPGQSPPPLLSGLRLRSGVIFGVVGGATALVANRLWP